MPKSRVDFWREKLEANRTRDEANIEALKALGWSVISVWECELKRPDNAISKLKAFLEREGE